MIEETIIIQTSTLFQELIEKSSDSDSLREKVGFAAACLTPLQVEGMCGAGHGECSASRESQRDRLWRGRAETVFPRTKFEKVAKLMNQAENDVLASMTLSQGQQNQNLFNQPPGAPPQGGQAAHTRGRHRSEPGLMAVQ